MEGSEGRRAQDMVKSGKGKASKVPPHSLSSVVVWEICIKGMVVSVPLCVCVCLRFACLVFCQSCPLLFPLHIPFHSRHGEAGGRFTPVKRGRLAKDGHDLLCALPEKCCHRTHCAVGSYVGLSSSRLLLAKESSRGSPECSQHLLLWVSRQEESETISKECHHAEQVSLRWGPSQKLPPSSGKAASPTTFRLHPNLENIVLSQKYILGWLLRIVSFP